jgi:alkyl sulfatase BDS1-like metallo-beta-lactamase superfamily hydrolase
MATRREFISTLPATGAAFAISGAYLAEGGPAMAQTGPALQAGHFHPKGKVPSVHTEAVLKAAETALPFSDTRDFDEFNRGFIIRREDPVIMNDAGGVAWDKSMYDFIDGDGPFPAIHPSLLRIARLNQNFGLYEVLPGKVYQVRGFDLSQTTFVRGRTGWIVFDVLLSAETMRAAWELFSEHRGEGLPISAVIYSHNHGDHWGGVRGIVTEEQVAAGLPIIAPDGFMESAVAENVFAGNAMNRRLFYQYGVLLPIGPFGYVTQGLGPRVSVGAIGLIAPTRLVADAIEEFEVDGINMVFQSTPNTESPAQMNTWIPEYRTLWMAENINATMHNIYTLRGAPVRDPLRWSKYIADALYRYADLADVMIASHHWPRWGKERIKEVLRGQRDMYANLNNQVLHLANNGVTINQVHNVYELPPALQAKWFCRGYHGNPLVNARGVVQRFLGFWDNNPTTLIPLSPADSAPFYVDAMGGAEAIMARARALHDEGNYLMACEFLDKIVQADPATEAAKEMLADAFEQLGYQQENPGLRNSFLSGAYELRSGIPTGQAADSSSPDVIRAMTTEQWLNFLGIKFDSRKAGDATFIINLRTPDNGEEFVIELANATLTNIRGFQAGNADLTLTLNRSDLTEVMMGAQTFEALVQAGAVTHEGDLGILAQLAGMMGSFDPLFEILPGTRTAAAATETASLEAVTGKVAIE